MDKVDGTEVVEDRGHDLYSLSADCLVCGHCDDAPAGSEALAISSMDAMRNEANTSLRGLTGAWPFFPFGILCSCYLHRDIERLRSCSARGGGTRASIPPKSREVEATNCLVVVVKIV